MKNVLEELQVPEGPSWPSRLAAALLTKLGKLKVIEIGTAYGNHLKTYGHLASRIVCIDPMYDWVPDITENDGFDSQKVDQRKIAVWHQNALECGNHIELITGNSYISHESNVLNESFEILLIDGCHHPASEVVKDYKLYLKHLTNPHYVVWDDLRESDIKEAVRLQKIFLEEQGLKVEEKSFNSGAEALLQFISK